MEKSVYICENPRQKKRRLYEKIEIIFSDSASLDRRIFIFFRNVCCRRSIHSNMVKLLSGCPGWAVSIIFEQ